MPSWWYGGFLVFLFLFFVAPPLLAARKGYKWYLWTILAMGVLGLIVMAFLPYANKPEQSPQEQQQKRKSGNKVGLVLSIVGVCILALKVCLAGCGMLMVMRGT